VRPDGEALTEEDWKNPEARSLGMFLIGRAADDVDARGRTVFGETVLLLLNAEPRSRLYTLPRLDRPGMREELLNTARPGGRVVKLPTVNLSAQSAILLRHNERL
jgi:isoamylase